MLTSLALHILKIHPNEWETVKFILDLLRNSTQQTQEYSNGWITFTFKVK